MRHSFAAIYIHLIFATYNREPFLTPSLADEMNACLVGISKNLSVKCLVVDGWFEHRHLLLEFPPTIAIADFVEKLKTNSSRWVRANRVPQFNWQRGYAAFSVSLSNVSDVKSYIANQQEHHRVRTFQEEYEAFLRNANVIAATFS